MPEVRIDKKYSFSQESINKELGQSDNDISRAKDSLEAADYKWATIQAYYSMFHAARAVLYSSGYREKSHKCILLFLDGLVDDGRLEAHFVRKFGAAMYLREEADYDASYSERSAVDTVENASAFLSRIKDMLK